MFSSADKTLRAAPAVQQKTANPGFFRKAGEETFFAGREKPSFFSPPVQPKLTVSQPNDPHEKEADAMADKVMRMPEPPVVASPPLVESGTSEQKPDRKEEETHEQQPASIEPLHMHASLEPERLHTKPAGPVLTGQQRPALHRSPSTESDTDQHTISLYPSDVMRQSGRGPPGGSIPFEQSLQASKGGGSPLSSNTLQFMESRFGADFSGVRIHTGAAAESMSSQVHAQAFAHGNDIYFNQGKYSPDSTGGRTLLAHELTHTIQQGASAIKTFPAQRAIARERQRPQTPLTRGEPAPSLQEERSPAALSDIAAKPLGKDAPASGTDPPAAAAPAQTGLQVNANGLLRSIALSSPAPETSIRKKDRQEDPHEELPPQVQTKSGTAFGDAVTGAGDSSNNTSTSYATVTTAPAVSRTPSDAGVIQRSLYDGALGRIGEFISDIPVLDLTSIEAAKKWLMTGVRRFASYIPGYHALGVALGHDPISGEEIAQNGRNFLEAGLDIMPGGALIKQKLEETGLLDKAAAWIDTQLATLSGIVQGVRSEFEQAGNALGLSSILDGPTAILRTLGNILERAVTQVIAFVRRAATELTNIIKRFLLDQLAGFVKQHTNAYDLLKVIMGKDPITDEAVARNGTNILNALLEMGGDAGREQRKQMQDTHTFEKAAAWIDRGIAVFGDLYSGVKAGFSQIWDAISIEALMHPVDTFTRIYETFAAPVRRVLGFVHDALAAILGFIKEALMVRLSAWARTVRGYPLLTVILGKDPFTNAIVPRSVENLVHGFMSLMDGGEEQFAQLQQSGAIARAAQRIDAAVARLNMTSAYVVQLFMQLWQSFSFTDLANPVAAFQRIIARFGEPIGRLVLFVVEIIRIVVEVVLQIMNFPSDLVGNIIARAMQAFEMIKRDPVGFLKNLLRAIKQGFVQFFNNIGRHLITGLQAWLMSELKDSGVQAPADFSLRGIIGWVLQLLGISMEKIWEKLAQHPRIGPQKVARIRGMIDQLEGIWTFIKDVQQRGVAAIWDKIQEKLGNLWDTLLDAIRNWIMEQVVSKVTAKLLSMLDPTGIMAVINSAIALYKAVQSFIKYLRQMLEIVNSFVEGVVQIASGNITVAANFLERSMARGVPVMIGFLANQVGLGGLGKRVGEMIEKVRGLVDQALTWLVNKAVNAGMGLLDRVMAMGKSAAGALAGWLGLKKTVNVKPGETHSLYFSPQQKLMMASTPVVFGNFLNTLTIPPHKQAALNPVKAGLASYLAQVDALLANTTMAEQEKTIKIQAILEIIGPEVAELIRETSGSSLKSEAPKYGGRHGGFGSSMRVRIVDGQPASSGSQPSVSGGNWDALRKRQTSAGGGDTFYIRAHLLNDNLGGPGNTWDNLSILSQTSNNRDWYGSGSHETAVETRLKGPLSEPGKGFIYVVTASYGRSVNGSLQSMISALIAYKTAGTGTPPVLPGNLGHLNSYSVARLQDLLNVIVAEQFVPTSFVCTIREIDPSTGDEVPGSDHNINRAITNDIGGPYYV